MDRDPGRDLNLRDTTKHTEKVNKHRDIGEVWKRAEKRDRKKGTERETV